MFISCKYVVSNQYELIDTDFTTIIEYKSGGFLVLDIIQPYIERKYSPKEIGLVVAHVLTRYYHTKPTADVLYRIANDLYPNIPNLKEIIDSCNNYLSTMRLLK